MDKPLFEDFNPVSEKEWKQKIQADLKGKDYNEVMITHTDEGIDIKPFYHQDSKTEVDVPSPGQWRITEKIKAEELKTEDDIKVKGTESLYLEFNQTSDIPEKLFDSDFEKIIFLKDFQLTDINVNASTHWAFDPLHTLMITGNWLDSQTQDLQKLSAFVDQYKTISIDARLYHNAGANISQQLAYTTAQLQFYLKSLKSSPDVLSIFIFTAVGTNYFFEIAKLKAFRVLVNSICKAHEIKYELKLVSEPGIQHMSIYDYNVNMLRSTTGCMSAILGGSDYVINTPYDDIFKSKSDFSTRISRNQLLILKHESYFDKVDNATDGTYYINFLIKALAEKALLIFKDIEKSGGLVKQLFDGKIQEKIKHQFQDTVQKFHDKSLKLVGVNVYVNEEDKMAQSLEKDEVFNQPKKRKTLIKPLKPIRIAEALEQKRLKEESAYSFEYEKHCRKYKP